MTNTIPEIQQTTIQIGDREYEGYKGPDGYYMNLRQIGRLLEKAPSSPSDFFATKTFKALYGKGLSPSDFSSSDGSTAKLIETSAVAVYIQHHASKGNKLAFSLALELMQQNLDIRIENALEPIKAEKVAEMTGQTPDWYLARNIARRGHGGFQLAAHYKGHPVARVHDRITKLVTGYTAGEACNQLPLVDGDPEIGLNHQASPTDLDLIDHVKQVYAGLKAGTWQEQVDRAYRSVMKIRSQADRQV